MKKERYNDDLLRLIDGTLDEAKARRLRAEVDRSPALRDRLNRLRDLQGLLRETALLSSQSAVAPFLTDRVMRRLEPAARRDDLTYAMSLVFKPVIAACLILVIGLTVYNLSLSADYAAETTTAEAILALPPVHSISVYDLDLYESTGAISLSSDTR